MSDCPSCKSSDTKSKAMVYASGTRNYSGSSSSFGASTTGRISSRSGNSQRTSQSALASVCAPPKKSSMPKIVIALLVFFVVMPILNPILRAGPQGDMLSGIIALPIIGLIVFGLFKLYKYLDRKNQKAIQEYSQQWICLRCGNSFIP